MGRRPLPSEVYREWEAIAFPKEGYPSDLPALRLQLERWKPLYERCLLNGEWKVSLDDAQLVASMGIGAYLILGEADKSLEVAEQFFSHPQASELSNNDRNRILYYLAGAQLETGDFEAGCRTLDAILQSKGYGAKTQLRQIVSALGSFAERADPEAPIPVILLQFALKVLGRIKGNKRLIVKLSAAKTMGEMRSAIEAVQL